MKTHAEEPILLRLEGIRKFFGGVQALAGVDFELRAGEIHALLGENGAGKTTLIKVLGGIHLPDAGSIVIDGEEVSIRGVVDADRCGIRIIHQELSLAPNLSIAENIYLGREPHRFGLLSRRTIYQWAEDLVVELGLDEIRDVRAEVSSLSVAHQQLVEIARALSSQARILVLDEPTSALSEAETEALFDALRRLRSQGVGMIYITHRLEEIARLADRVTVLRDGESIGTQGTTDLDRTQLIRWMVGRDVKDHFRRPTSHATTPALEVDGLRSAKVHGVSIEVRHGEILGFAGLVGSGRSEMARAIFGIDPVDSGQIKVDGREVTINGPRDALDAGIVLVPEDRKLQGLVLSQSVTFNATLPWLKDWITGFVPNERKRKEIVERAIRTFGIKVADPGQTIDSLSGGNQQKLLVGRWMEHPPKVLILDEPTRGVDVGAREEIFDIIGSLVEGGMAVVLISSDLGEVLNLSNRIAVYRDGRIIDTADADRFTLENIMQLLTGAEAA
jgi:ABC-type sugar transport system ATPase subunit